MGAAAASEDLTRAVSHLSPAHWTQHHPSRVAQPLVDETQAFVEPAVEHEHQQEIARHSNSQAVNISVVKILSV